MDNQTLEKVVVILSGGLDSTVLTHKLVKAKRRKKDVHAITFDYGQLHSKEIECARRTAIDLQIPWKIVKIQLPFHNTALLNKDILLPTEDYSTESQKITVVPNRNMILLSIAAGYAEEINAKKVYYGAHKNDYAVYPDCRPKFISAVSRATMLGTYNKVKVLAPFSHKLKSDIIKLGVKLDVDFSKTWSCYKGGDFPCGLCGTCRERIKAFEEAGIKDSGKEMEEREAALSY